jgi:hypothetical protein
VAWLLVAFCGLSAFYCLLRTVSARHPLPRAERHRAGGEAAMGGGMALMAVPAASWAPPGWACAVLAALFAAAAVRAAALTRRHTPHHAHHAIGAAAMAYAAAPMAAGGPTAMRGMAGMTTPSAGVPLLTAALAAYFAVYAVAGGVRLMTAPGPGAASGPYAAPEAAPGPPGWLALPELATACRVGMALAMLAMLLTM